MCVFIFHRLAIIFVYESTHMHPICLHTHTHTNTYTYTHTYTLICTQHAHTNTYIFLIGLFYFLERLFWHRSQVNKTLVRNLINRFYLQDTPDYSTVCKFNRPTDASLLFNRYVFYAILTLCVHTYLKFKFFL